MLRMIRRLSLLSSLMELMMVGQGLSLGCTILRSTMLIGCGCSGWFWRWIGVVVERGSLVAVVEMSSGKGMEIEALEE